MVEQAKKDVIAQWAFDCRPVLGRFHLWLEDVDVAWERGERVEGYTFVPRGIRRCLAMTTAVTALGTKLFGPFGEAPEGTSAAMANQIKKQADAMASYIMSEGLWYTTRGLPENHAIMVGLGEGLMPKLGENIEMGPNPLLGYGRVYARPEVAKYVDFQVRRMLNEPDRGWDDFYAHTRSRGITLWGAAVDTLENTTRFALGDDTGPMAVLHVFDQPLAITKPYETYVGTLVVPKDVVRAAEDRSILIDVTTPRARVVEAIGYAYPGIKPANIHVWTLGGEKRAARLDPLWREWREAGAHLVTEDWETPAGYPIFYDSGTYAPTYMVGRYEQGGEQHVFLVDGYAASAEAMQAASLSEAFDLDVSMALFSTRFKLPYDRERQVMQLDPEDPRFRERLEALCGEPVDEERAEAYRSDIRDALDSNVPVGQRTLRIDDLFPEKRWRGQATAGYMCTDPYTGTPGVERLSEDRFRVTSRLATRKASVRCAFTFRLMKGFEDSRLVFSPLLIRHTNPGTDYRSRPVKVSDSGRIRNELQTMLFQALEYQGGQKIRVHFDRIDEKMLPPERKDKLWEVLRWYQESHPVWFHWLEIV